MKSRKRKFSSGGVEMKDDEPTETNGQSPPPEIHSSPFLDTTKSDWTLTLKPSPILDTFLAVDWASSQLGPLAQWGSALRLYTTFVFADSRPSVLYWGPECIAIYNEHYPFMLGKMHPALMGSRFKSLFPEVWDDLRPIFESVRTTATAVDVNDIELYIESRYGYMEESYFFGQFIPVRGDSGQVEGVFHTVVETTGKVMHERRRKILDNIAAIGTKSTTDTLVDIINVLRTSPRDITMAMLYCFDSVADVEEVNLRCIGSIGIRAGHSIMPEEACLQTSNTGLIPFFRQTRASASRLTLDTSDPQVASLFHDISWQGFEEASREVVIVPLLSSGTTLGFYVQGTNPRRPLDDTTEVGILDLARQIEMKWRSALSQESYETAVLTQRQQEDFIDTTSHELRNPLQAMMQLADGIHRSAERQADTIEACQAIIQENVDAAKTILACTAQQKRVIDDVLMLSRLRTDMLSIEMVPENPREVVQHAIKMSASESSINDIDLTWDEAPSTDTHDGDIQVLCDPTRVIQILINLLGNAIKFTANRPTRKVHVTYGLQSEEPTVMNSTYGEIQWMAAQKPSKGERQLPALSKDDHLRRYLYFIVQDTGKGVSQEEMQTKLFRRFSQGSSRTHITYGGTGLGLYICQELAEKQQGRVGLASHVDTGSVFAFYIETRLVTTPTPKFPIPGVTPSPLPHLPRNPTPTPPDLQGYHLLLVEDNLVNQRVLAAHLRRIHCKITIANHGAEALEFLLPSPSTPNSNPSHTFDAILMDWEMPVLSGIECTQRIRAYEVSGEITRRIPILGTTANVRPAQVRKAMEAGMDAVLAKPFVIGELVEMVRRFAPKR